MTLHLEETSRSTEQTLLAIERQLAAQAEETRKLRKNAVFFGGMVTLIALVSLVAVTAKLGTKDIHVTASAPAAQPAAKAPAAALPTSSNVTLKEFKLIPSATTVAAGKVTFHVTNTGTMTHEFVVLKTDAPAAHLPLAKDGRADESTNIGETGDVKAGASKTLSLTLKAGHYALICNLAGHYKAGQFADLTVK